MPRFVLLRHKCPESYHKPSHWDFMLEWGDVLRTWELRELPTGWAEQLGVTEAADCVDAIALNDHRLAYLDFEGPLTGDRGAVQRCDEGLFELTNDDPESLEIELSGQRFCGRVRLKRSGTTWRLTEFP